MPDVPNLLQSWLWERRIARMKRCSTSEELVKRFGRPVHRIEDAGTAIWRYPLKQIGGTLYAIHVAVIDGMPSHIYLHMEPATTFSSR